MADDEVVALYDAAGAVVGSAPRSVMRSRNLRHAASSVVVRDPMGRIYVHRRTPTKDVYPGLLDFAAGGVVLAGEDPAVGAVREVEEELGVHGVPLEPLGVTHYADERTDYLAVRFVTTWDGAIRWQPEEVSWGEWVTVEELVRRLDEQPSAFVPDSVAVWSETIRSWRLDRVPLQQGWDSVTTLVEGRWVDRVARRPDGERALLTEVALLARLADSLPLEVPRPTVMERHPVRVRHTRVDGAAVDPLALTAEDGWVFASFLSALHATPLRVAAEAGCPTADDDERVRAAQLSRFRQVVLPRLPDSMVPVGEQLLRRVGTVSWQVLCHGDLVAEHLLARDGRVHAVIDWGDARVTDPALDLAWALNATTPGFARAVVEGVDVDAELGARSRDRWALAPWYEAERAAGDAAHDASGTAVLDAALDAVADRLTWWRAG
ncbi:phosphotransferase [Terrabacter sp. NPDC080008]|uniref:phosphotransferase n=1 Tax=Terrabacter sp. NPDC080008 TaxID=3155176 RepID=UPI00344E7207